MNKVSNTLLDVAMRIKEMREILGYSQEDMAQKTDTSLDIMLSMKQVL